MKLKEKLKAGRVASLDLAIVKAEAASRKKSLIDAKTAHLQKMLRLSYLISDKSFGYGDSIALSDTPPPPDPIGNLDDILKVALEYRPDLRQANLLARKGDLDVVQTLTDCSQSLNFL
jgi:outer membrane protein TolC